MIRDITIGQYYEKETCVHALDPRTKIIATFVYILSMFFYHRLLGCVVSAVFLGVVIKSSKVPFRHIFRGVKPIAMILLFTMCVHILLAGREFMRQSSWEYACVYWCLEHPC